MDHDTDVSGRYTPSEDLRVEVGPKGRLEVTQVDR